MASRPAHIQPWSVFETAMAAPPMTSGEKAIFRSQIAAEIDRAEARRQPTPQLPLEAAA